jgi:hypothetical protein
MLVRYAGKRARFVAIGDIRQRLYISDSPFQRAIVRGAIMEGRGGAASIQMNYCHRCPPNVLAAANCVSLMTYGRLHSEVTGRENGETQSIRAIAFATMEDELEYICSQIKSGRAGRSAVLFPSASRERAGELPCAYGALRAHGLSYNYDYKVFDASKDVTVTTIHSSKGSEWDHVYVAGMQSTRFPFSSATNEIARNTFYVALTRARVSCEFLSWHERVHSRMTMLVEEIPGLFNLEYKYQPARAPAVSAPDFNFRPIPVTKLVEEHETAEIGNGDVRVEKLPPIQLRHACEEIPPGDMRLIYGMFADIAIKRELVPGYMPPVYHAYRLNEVRRLTTDELRSLVNKGALIHAEGSAYVDVAAGNVVFCTMSDGFNDVSQATNELLCGDPKNVAVLWEIAKLDFYINRKYGYMQHIAVDVERCEKILENCSVIAAQLKGEYTTFKCDPVVRGESLCGICDVAARRDETTTILEFKYSIDDNNFFAITGNSMQCALYRRLAHVPAAVAINIATGSRQIITGDTFFSRVTDYISARFIVASVNRFNQLKCVRESPIPTYIAAGCAAPRILSIGDPFRRKKCTSFSEVVEFCDPFKSAKLAIYMSLPVFRAWRESGFPFPPGWEFRPVLAPEMPLLAEHPTPTDADLMWCYRCLGLTPQTS